MRQTLVLDGVHETTERYFEFSRGEHLIAAHPFLTISLGGDMNVCECGCEGVTQAGAFLPGHDQRLRTSLEKRVGGLLALKRLVELCEAHVEGRVSAEALSRTVRSVLERPEGAA